MAASSSAGAPPGSVENSNLVSLLGTTRTLTRIWVLVGLLVGLLSVVTIVLSAIALHFYGGGIGGLVYALVWVVVDILLLDRIGGWLALLSAGRYSALKEPLLLWGILALIFGVVPGILLLLIYARILPWSDSGAPGATPPQASAVVPPGAANPPVAGGSPPPQS